MKVLPSDNRSWLRLVLFPFKAYTVLAIISVFIWGSALPRHSQQVTAVIDAGLLIVLGYLVSFAVLFVGGLFQAFAKSKDSSASVTFLFAGAALLIAFWLLPRF